MRHRLSFSMVSGLLGLVASGQSTHLGSPTATGSWTSVDSMSESRAGACAARLASGQVLIVGGIGSGGALGSTELFDADSGFSSAASMSTPRSGQTCVTLQDGRVLVAGGSNDIAPLGRAEIYDPVSNSWSPVGDMAFPRTGHTATLLKNGRVLIAGGEGQGAVWNALEFFDPNSNSFRLVTSSALSSARKGHGAVLLSDGRVLIAGGSDGRNALDSTEVYDPETGTLAPGPQLSARRAGLSATVLMDGTVFVAGGNDGSRDLTSAEILTNGKFEPTAAMTASRSGQMAFLLPDNNQVLLVGGDQENGSAELFTPWRNSFRGTGTRQDASKSIGAPLAAEGTLLLSGGISQNRSVKNSSVYHFPTLKAGLEDNAFRVTGSGWQPNERVTLVAQRASQTRENTTHTVTANRAGNISDDLAVDSAPGTIIVTATSGGFTANAAGSVGANLDQCADGANLTVAQQATAVCSWVNGNVNGSKATYFEGDSLPYRLVMTNVPTGNHQVTIEWDTTQSGKHALDYLTTFNRTISNANPCASVAGCGGTPATFAIPVDPNVVAGGVTPIAGNFTIYGATGTPTASAYTLSGSYASSSSTRITISFTSSTPNVVLAWSAHIGTRIDWGAANSAVAITGSPYHTRLIDFDGGGGNQDRSLSSDAAIFPATITVKKVASPQSGTVFGFTATGGLSPSTFNLKDDGASSNTQVFSNISNFTTYTVAETALTGWTLSAPSTCTLTSPNGGTSSLNGSTYTLNVKEGENYTCTFTNTAQTANVVLTKVLSPTGDDGKFNLTVNGTTTLNQGNGGTASASVAVNGTATLSEAAGAGMPSNVTLAAYTSVFACQAGITVNNNTGTSGSFTVPLSAAGTTINCTITNTRKHHAVMLTKTVVGPIGTATFSLTLNDNGSATTTPGMVNGSSFSDLSVNVGNPVTVSEVANANFTTNVGCVAGGSSLTFTSGGGANTTGAFTMPDSDVNCTITNTRISHKVTLSKIVSDSGIFDLKISTGGVDTNGPGLGNGGSIFNPTVYAGNSVTVSETQKNGYNATALTCSGGSVSVTVTQDKTSGTFTMPFDADVTCSITNQNVTATLTITKVCAASPSDPNFGTATFATVINQGATQKASFSLTCGGGTMSHTETLIAGAGTEFTVIETPPNTGWYLGGALFTPGWSSPGPYGGNCDAAGKVTLTAGDAKTCFILNVATYCAPAFPPVGGVSSIIQPAAVPRGTRRPAAQRTPQRSK